MWIVIFIFLLHNFCIPYVISYAQSLRCGHHGQLWISDTWFVNSRTPSSRRIYPGLGGLRSEGHRVHQVHGHVRDVAKNGAATWFWQKLSSEISVQETHSNEYASDQWKMRSLFNNPYGPYTDLTRNGSWRHHDVITSLWVIRYDISAVFMSRWKK